MLSCLVCGMVSTVAANTAGLNMLQSGSQVGKGAAHQDGDSAAAHHRSLVLETTIQHQLVVCNAYASEKPLDIVRARTKESITGGSPLAYKQCRDYSLPLEDGEQLDFEAGGIALGTFYTTGLPRSSSSLLLIPNKRNPDSPRMSFQSHAFAEAQSPQIAIIDVFRGKDTQETTVKIMDDVASNKEKLTQEELSFNTVVAINPGKYQVSLSTSASRSLAINTAGANKYVIMRLGSEGKYPEELVVFPSGAGCMRIAPIFIVMATFLGFRS